MRVFYLVLANLALPFLLFYLRNAIYKVQGKKIPALNIKRIIKLLICGVALLATVLFYFRFTLDYEDRGARNEVKQYNLR